MRRAVDRLVSALERFVVPRRFLRTRHDAGNVGVFAAGGLRRSRPPLLGFLPPRGFHLLLFLLRALARALVLGWSGLLHGPSGFEHHRLFRLEAVTSASGPAGS